MSRVDPLNPLYLSTILLNQPQLTSGFKRKMIAMAKSDMHASRWEAGDISPPIETSRMSTDYDVLIPTTLERFSELPLELRDYVRSNSIFLCD